MARERATAAEMAQHVELVKATALAVKDFYLQVENLYLVGASIRGKVGRDIDFVGEVPPEARIPAIRYSVAETPWSVPHTEGQVINMPMTVYPSGKRRGVKVVVDIFFAYPSEVKTTVLHYGLGKDIIRWKTIARKKGYLLNRYGLWKGTKKVSGSPAKIANILGTKLPPFIQASLENPL